MISRARSLARMLSVGIVTNFVTTHFDNILLLSEILFQFFKPVGRMACLFVTGFVIGRLSRRKKPS
jgi:hypothetical protein